MFITVYSYPELITYKSLGEYRMRAKFVEGVDDFVDYAMILEYFRFSGLIKHSYQKCQCMNFEKSKIVEFISIRRGSKNSIQCGLVMKKLIILVNSLPLRQTNV